MSLPSFLPSSPDRYKPLLLELKELPKPVAEACLRVLDKWDLYFLLRFTLSTSLMRRPNQPDVSWWDHPWIFDRCRDLQDNPNRVHLWAREHGKSTCITFGLTIQEILRNPEETIGIFSHTRPIAKAFLRKIKVELEQNERLKRRHPDALYLDPQNESPKWNEDEGITVKRRGNPAEQTVEAWGIVDGQPISKHFGIRVGDDLVTRDSVNTPEMMLKTEEYWALSLNLGKAGGQERYAGTRYHFSDLYALMRDRGHLELSVHPARNPAKPDGISVFLPPDYLDKQTRSMGPYVSASQYLLNPIADEAQGFRQDWRLTYETDPSEERRGKNIYILVDPAGAKSRRSDYTSMWVVGLGPDQNYYVLDGLRDRLNLAERADRLFELHALYNDRRNVMEIRYEQYALSADIEHIAYLQDRRNYRFHLTPVGGAVNKQARIRRLVPMFQEKRIYFPKGGIHKRDYRGQMYDLCKVFFEEEFLSFPVGTHDDMLDCLARIAEPDLPLLWPQPGEYLRDKNFDPYDAKPRRQQSNVSWMGM